MAINQCSLTRIISTATHYGVRLASNEAPDISSALAGEGRLRVLSHRIKVSRALLDLDLDVVYITCGGDVPIPSEFWP
ncbi:hypothetical protein RRG08_059685 [Elysia crispata]|uniref:Uncharacterized protein n=1 Tax=Elysia crispata TaxID=231223 RepID=A0AAE1B4X5_9GAST|nr:hypothetical protein RRG08_059685 [Elysia crispata]